MSKFLALSFDIKPGTEETVGASFRGERPAEPYSRRFRW